MICIVCVHATTWTTESSTASPPGTWRRNRDDSASATTGRLCLSPVKGGAVRDWSSIIFYLDPGHRGSYNTGHRTHASSHVRHKTSRVVSLDMGHVVTVWSSWRGWSVMDTRAVRPVGQWGRHSAIRCWTVQTCACVRLIKWHVVIVVPRGIVLDARTSYCISSCISFGVNICI